jgi:2-oxoglutarate dehydrogenase E2 component (dihydrolipoamide succinyltransferase)
MRVTAKLPRLGETVDEVVVLEWHKQVGDDVAQGEPLLSVETAKAVTDVPAPVSGRLVELLVAPDDEVTTGTPVAVLDAAG